VFRGAGVLVARLGKHRGDLAAHGGIGESAPRVGVAVPPAEVPGFPHEVVDAGPVPGCLVQVLDHAAVHVHVSALGHAHQELAAVPARLGQDTHQVIVHKVALAEQRLVVRREILIAANRLSPGVVGGQAHSPLTPIDSDPLPPCYLHAPLERAVISAAQRGFFSLFADDMQALKILEPISLAELARGLERHASVGMGIVLEETPAHQHIAALVVAGDDAGLWGADDAIGDDGASLVAQALDDALPGIVLTSGLVVYILLGVADGLERATAGGAGVIGHVHDLHVVQLPTLAPAEEEGRAGDAQHKGIGARDLALGVDGRSMPAAIVGLAQVFDDGAHYGGKAEVLRAAGAALVEMDLGHVLQEHARRLDRRER